MSDDVEFEGKNVTDALKCASEAMNVPADDLRYDVISYGSTGIFGLVGAKKARIRIINDSDVVPPRNRSTDDIKAEILSTLDDRKTPAAKTEETDETGKAPSKGQRWQPVPNADITDAITKQCREALLRIAGAITEEVEIVDECLDGRLVLNLVGGNSGALIGKRGQTLEAIQYLVEKIVNKGREDRVRILVDVEGYIENRRANLKQLASRMAEKAKKKGRPTTIGQMNAHDRRIIHLALKDDVGVRTQSVGEGHFRKLVIYPKNNGNRRRRSAQRADTRR